MQAEVPPWCFLQKSPCAASCAVSLPGPEVPEWLAGSSGQRNFRSTSGQVPEIDNCGSVLSSKVFSHFRNLAGTWPELPVTGSSALVPPTLCSSAGLMRKHPAGTSGPPGRNFRCYTKTSITVRSESPSHINSFLLHWDKLLNHYTKFCQASPPLEPPQEHKICKISSFTQAKLLIFGDSKEKTPIYILTEAIFICPSYA